MRTRTFIAAAAALVILAAGPAPAQTLGGVTFHGFVSQGFLKSTDNNWLSAPTSEGTFAFTEAALNFNIEANMDYVWGGALDWRVRPGLRLKISGNTSDSTVSNSTTYSGYMTQGPAPVPIPVSLTTHTVTNYKQDYVMFYSAEYRRGGLRLAGEYHMAKNVIENTTTGLPFPVPTMTITEHPVSWYGQVAYRFNKIWEVSGYYSSLYLDKNDKDGMRFVVQGQPAHRSWLKQWTFTGRADINKHWLVKAEVGFMDGTAGVSLLDNPDGLTEKWKLFALQTVVHF